jgi:hypothetical protein
MSLVCKYLHVNTRLYANISQQIFAWMWIRLKFCEYLLQNKYFEANIRQYEKMLKQTFDLMQINICFKMYLFCIKLNIFNANLCEYFEVNIGKRCKEMVFVKIPIHVNMKQITSIFALICLEGNKKKLWIWGILARSHVSHLRAHAAYITG